MLHALSHPELKKEVPRFNNSGHPDQDERKANPGGFELAIAKETEQRIGDKNEPSEWGEQNQYEKVVHVTLSHEVHIEQRTGNQDGAYESTYERISADSSARALNLWSWVHVAQPLPKKRDVHKIISFYMRRRAQGTRRRAFGVIRLRRH